ncbi:MAG: TonB-dependent receptor [Balneolales bacterium]
MYNILRTNCLPILLLFTLSGISWTADAGPLLENKPGSLQIQNQRHTISGTITDKNTGESLIGVTVRVLQAEGTGAATNAYGFYSMTLPERNYTLVFSYIGYQQQTRSVTLDENKRINIELDDAASQLEEFTVTARRPDENVSGTQSGINRINMNEINQIPVFMGERDVLKSIQLLPGVQAAGEGNTGFFVRGGSVDQNLILLDGAPVYNASHLMGFFSTFNSDAIKDATLYKGSMPAEFGGRIASVLDIQMNEGNNQSYGGSGGIGLISTNLNVEGPIQQGKSSFLISGRRTYADMFLKLSADEAISGNSLYFYDLNAKANFILSGNNRIYLSGYFGRDKLGFQDMFGIDWGNRTGTLRWNHLINDRMFSNTSLIFSDYSYNINIDFDGDEIGILSRIRDWNLKQEFEYFPNPRNTIKFGVNTIYHTITPGEITVSESSGFNPMPLQDRYSWENAFYVSNEWSATPNINVNYGVRLSSFSILGEGDFYTLDEQHQVTDTTSYQSGEFVDTHFNIEPRLSASYQFGGTSSVKASYARSTQNMHLLSNSTTTNPTDRWIPSSNIIKPQTGDQVSMGYFRNFSDNRYELSTEIYYKHMQNQVDYKDGADVTNSDMIETELLFGQGRAYGVELLFKKTAGRFSGWVGYTLARTESLIEGINNDNWYPARQDRTHDITVVGMYNLSDRWSLSASWVYNTGNAVTFPSGKYTVDDQVIFYYTERNGYRMPDYHRLDIGATWKLRQGDKFSSDLSFSIYNAYGRENPYVINFRENEKNPSATEAYQIALFKLVPAITYKFKF